jgi:AraC-like DNA-binding protein
VWGAQVTGLSDRLQTATNAAEKFRALEDALLCVRGGGGGPLELHPAVAYGLRAFRQVSHIRSVIGASNEAGLSRRRFTQLFREQIGMTPKAYCRLLRFRHIVRQIASGAPVDWAAAALAGGYCDQAHLAHEFRAFSGMSPTAFLAAERPFINHVRVD